MKQLNFKTIPHKSFILELSLKLPNMSLKNTQKMKKTPFFLCPERYKELFFPKWGNFEAERQIHMFITWNFQGIIS